MHLDRAHDTGSAPALLEAFGFGGTIAREGVPAPLQAAAGWVVERAQHLRNGYGKLRRCTEQRHAVVDFYLSLAATIVVIRQLSQRARARYRWDSRSPTRRLK